MLAAKLIAEIEYFGYQSRIFFLRVSGQTIIVVSRGDAIEYCRAHNLIPHFVN